MYRRHRRAVRRSEGSTTISQRSKRDRDTEPDLIRNQDILRKISTTKKLPRSFVMGSEASERSEKNPITTSKATQRGTVSFPSTSRWKFPKSDDFQEIQEVQFLSGRILAKSLLPEPKTSLKCSLGALVSGNKLRFSKKNSLFPTLFRGSV